MGHKILLYAITAGILLHARAEGDRYDEIWTTYPVTERAARVDSNYRVFDFPKDFKKELILTVSKSNDFIPKKSCSMWKKMLALPGEEKLNSKSCEYHSAEHRKSKEHLRTLDRFMDQFAPLLEKEFDVTNCNYPANQPRAFVTLTRPEYAHDKMHMDNCPDRFFNDTSITVVTYVHEVWDPKWEGHFELAEQRCNRVEQLITLEDEQAEYGHIYPGKLGAVARVAPMPNTTIIFSNELLHRATPANELATAPNPTKGHYLGKSKPGDRYSFVLQLICNKEPRKRFFEESKKSKKST